MEARVDYNSTEAVREWLLKYAWAENTPAQKAAVVDCIMANHFDAGILSARADACAGAASEPGPQAFTEAVLFELSALYECHGAPHSRTCPGNE